MSDRDIYPFIREHVRSVWALELLLKLKSDPARVWTVEALVVDLRASAGLVVSNLEALGRSDLVLADEGGFRYRPAAPILAQLCDDLEAAYRDRPVTVIRWISKPAERLQSLADAFKFRGRDE
ncbi:MAG: hypothetical protein J7521_05640 [Caulobacter sp.]|nr:hypothetical protein [Caulobacter sp.]